MKATFKLDGHIGSIDTNGFIVWYTVSCWVDSLADCRLRQVALKALGELLAQESLKHL